jgi:predicted N-acetyltransferase YhbS
MTITERELHVSSAYRKHGVGRQLFELAKARAKAMGARAPYELGYGARRI